MNPDSYDVYTRSDGSHYFIQPDQSTVNLSYYNPNNGDYAEINDDTIYDYQGNDTGKSWNGSSIVAQSGGGTSWLDVLNSGINAAGSIFGNKNNTTSPPAGQYMPIGPAPAQPSTAKTVWTIVGVLAGVVLVVVVVKKLNKKGSTKAAAPAK